MEVVKVEWFIETRMSKNVTEVLEIVHENSRIDGDIEQRSRVVREEVRVMPIQLSMYRSYNSGIEPLY